MYDDNAATDLPSAFSAHVYLRACLDLGHSVASWFLRLT